MNTVNAPLKNFAGDGSTLFNWLGSFWSQIFEQPELIRQDQMGNGLLSAQLYLNFLESMELLNRNNAPVFHRERWHPVVIRKSQANTGTAALLQIGMDPLPAIGPQVNNQFIQDKVLGIGGTAAYANVVSYPMPPDVVDVLTCVTSNIASPRAILVRDQDYAVQDGTIFFTRTNDPFNNANFPRRTVRGTDGELDEEIMLWACDTLFDKDYVYNYIGYVMNIRTRSTEFAAKLLNTIWDLYNQGTPLALLTSAIGALLGEPTVLNAYETVDTIILESDYTKVVTDKEVYRVNPNAVLRDTVVPRGVLQRGELLTETVRIYDTLDPMKLAGVSEFGERLRTDVPAMFIGRDLLRAPVRFGIAAGWESQDIVYTGTDTNGNPKLKFKVYGTPEDVNTFWSDYWNYLETHNISSQTCFKGYLNDTVLAVEGSVWGSVPPLEYFMRYYFKANAFIIVLDRDNLTIRPDADSLKVLSILKQVLPVHVLMLMVERRGVGPDEYNLEDVESVPLKAYANIVTNTATFGGPSKTKLTYTDRKPILRWVAVCK